MRKMKKGVSLVTVLLFMMVATIAATATYKWLSSIGTSSAARLQMSEARQAAISGIEAARSWMTFKGNDLGAVIRQYFQEGKKPILLNSVLPKMKAGRMNDSVWLMGVNIENSSKYKLKIVSLGTTRDNVKYSEVAIFNVSGLYQAEIPTDDHIVNFKDAFHGGLTTANVIDVSSAIIKQTTAVKNAGGQALTSIKADEYLVLDGDFYVNDGGNVNDLYVSGDLSFLKNLTVGGNLYVGGKLYGTSTSSRMNVLGSTYLNGGMKINNMSQYVKNSGASYAGGVGGQFNFNGNVTSNGDIDHLSGETSVSYIKMSNNLVLNGKLVFPSNASKKDSLIVLQNAFISGNSTNSGSVDFDNMYKTRFGSGSGDKLYFNGFQTYTDNNVCENGFYKCAQSQSGNIYIARRSELIPMPSPEEIRDWNADSLVAYRDMISGEKNQCGFSQDRIQFNTAILGSSFVHSEDSKLGCSDDIWKNDIEIPVEALNACYNIASGDDQLFDKTWLIVNWNHAPQWSPQKNIAAVKKLSGNFIFVINESSAPLAELELPETEADAMVMLYLPDGWKNTNPGFALRTNLNKSIADYHYFIYSAGDIGRFITRPLSRIKGGIYMEGCSMLNTLGGKDTLAVDFYEPLFKRLVKSSVLCEYDGTKTCSNFSGAVSGFGPDMFQTMDPYHVATSPQLIVEIESQYKNNEPLPKTAQEVKPSEVVLPRVIYLPRDAYGYLSDYYNVLALNGSTQTKIASNMHCPEGKIPTADSKLSSGGGLPEGKFLCSYGDGADTIPVYLVVEGSLSENSGVHFASADEKKDIVSGHSVDIHLSATKSDATIELDISVPENPPSGWTIEGVHSGLSVKSTENGKKIWTLRTTPTGDDLTLFKVRTTEHAELGSVIMNLKSCVNASCVILQPSQSYVYMSNRVVVEREDVRCDNINTGAFKHAYGFECSELASMPACDHYKDDNGKDSKVWVTARGQGCFALEPPNERWDCYTGSNQVYLDSVLVDDDYCTAYIPPKTVELSSYESVYKLPAVLKRKRSPLKIKIVNPNSQRAVNIKVHRAGNDEVSHKCDDECSYGLYADDTVYISKEGPRFSYWTCYGTSCNDSDPNKTYSESEMKLLLKGGMDSVTAWFDQKDGHCFYTNFQDFKSDDWCSLSDIEARKQCLDSCKNGAKHCSAGQTPYEGSVEGSDWLIVYSNDNRNNGNGFALPQIDNREGNLMHPKDFGRKVILKQTIGKPTVILNNALAGSNGMMTAMLKIPSATSQIISSVEKFLTDNPLKKFIKMIPLVGNAFEIIDDFVTAMLKNSLLIHEGLIIRSNADASEYFTLNIVAKEPIVFARLCYVQGQDNDIDHCHDIRFETGFNDDWPTTASRLSRLTLNVDVDGSVIKAILSRNWLQGSFEAGMASVEFDLNDPVLKQKFNGNTLNDDLHQYVGLKIGYPYIIRIDIEPFFLLPKGYQETIATFPALEFFDVGWRSYDYDANCWDTPKVSCSFKPNYAGGMVPDSIDVTPWVGMSSWFDNQNCDVTYYYNGCDLRQDKFAQHFQILTDHVYTGNEVACKLRRPRGSGLYNFSGRKLSTFGLGRLASDKYWFEDEGYHGYPIETARASGFVNEASVVVTCRRDEETDNTHIYDASCGDFIVGEYEQCSESFTKMLSYPVNCNMGDLECPVTLDTVYNVREANLIITLDEETTSNVEPYLVDLDSNVSALNVKKLNATEYLIDVESASGAPGFNPQNVAQIKFKNVSSYFRVTNVRSDCRYAFNVECNAPSYNSITGMWTVSAVVTHPEKAESCEVIPLDDASGADIPDPQSCGIDFMQMFKQEGVYGQNIVRNYAFKVVARDDDGEVMDSCVTPVKTVDPLEIHCSTTPDTVESGMGVSPLTFRVENCPPEGCDYTIEYPPEFNLETKSGKYMGGEIVHCPDENCMKFNTSNNKLPSTPNPYVYDLKVMGRFTCPYDSNEFYVAPEPEKGTCNDHKIEDGYFVAHIGFAQDGYWGGTIAGSARIVYTDMIGNVIGIESQHIGTNALHKDSTELFNEYIKGKDVELRYKLPENMLKCNKGVCTYLVTLLLHGGDFCSEKWNVRNLKGLNSNCPSIENQNPNSGITFRPVMSGCEDTLCVWSVWRNDEELKHGSKYNGMDALTFDNLGLGSAGTKTYRFKVSAEDEYTSALDSCDFSVTYTNDALSVTNCGFVGSADWGGYAQYSFATNCANCEYELRSSSRVISGKTSVNEYDNTSVSVSPITKMEQFELTVNHQKINGCTATPSLNAVIPSCKIEDKTELYSDESARFTATFNTCEDGSCEWPWVLKKNGGEIYSGTVKSNEMIEKVVTGGGTYALYLNGSNEAACTIYVTNVDRPSSAVGSCSFDKPDGYAYGATGIKFIVNGLTANIEPWHIKKVPTEAIVRNGTFEQYIMDERKEFDMPTDFAADNKRIGAYKFELPNSDVPPCTSELKVKTPRVSRCERSCSGKFFGICTGYKLDITVENCANCSYYVVEGNKRGSISTSATVTDLRKNDYTVRLNDDNSTDKKCSNK
ncbi:hypothetical protein [uncultured Fibrobacter sp.]|uniref:hypothetical protein n=1 Tax=uncultured Fibrobacter sp. TaxID=261512 RepID=UPI00263883E0|nr:hypothetical protein [uncultured Fibrobacter sp.]